MKKFILNLKETTMSYLMKGQKWMHIIHQFYVYTGRLQILLPVKKDLLWWAFPRAYTGGGAKWDCASPRHMKGVGDSELFHFLNLKVKNEEYN